MTRNHSPLLVTGLVLHMLMSNDSTTICNRSALLAVILMLHTAAITPLSQYPLSWEHSRPIQVQLQAAHQIDCQISAPILTSERTIIPSVPTQHPVWLQAFDLAESTPTLNYEQIDLTGAMYPLDTNVFSDALFAMLSSVARTLQMSGKSSLSLFHQLSIPPIETPCLASNRANHP